MPKKFGFEDRIIQDILLLTARDDFLFEIETLRNKHQSYFESIEIIEAGDDSFTICDEKLEELFTEDVGKLTKKYKLSEIHETYLSMLIREGNVHSHEKFIHFVHLNPNTRVETKNCVTLQVYPETSLQNIIDGWPRIKAVRDHLPIARPDRRNKIENLERDLYILRLKKQGVPVKDIPSEINKKYKKSVVSYADIPIIIRRLKDRANRLTTSKQS